MATYESKKYATIPIVATQIADQSVSNAEFETLDGSDTSTTIQAQLNAVLGAGGGTMTGNLNFGDDVKARFGDSNDLEIFHDGNNSIVKDVGTGDLVLGGDNVQITNAALSENQAVFTSTGAATLYHNNSAKLATTSSGVNVTGTLSATTALSGNGSSITNLNASNLSSGTVPAARLPVTGRLLKMQTLVSGSNYDTTSVIAFDASTPTSSEGIQVMAQVYTPVASNSQLLHVLSSAVTNASAGGICIWSIFNGSSNIGAFAKATGSSASWNQFTCQAYESSSNNTTGRTYSVRFGVNTSRGHWLQNNFYNYYLNAKAVYTIFEIAA
jgi:hypothetical protein